MTYDVIKQNETPDTIVDDGLRLLTTDDDDER